VWKDEVQLNDQPACKQTENADFKQINQKQMQNFSKLLDEDSTEEKTEDIHLVYYK
jgi:hypothetical protein